jgi:hypothetical protein
MLFGLSSRTGRCLPQPHPDGSLEPLSGLATRPSYFRTWPFVLAQTAAHRLTPFLPESIRSQLPSSFIPESLPEGDIDSGKDEAPVTPLNRRSRSKQQAALRAKSRSNTNTPRDSPATTELESDAVGEDGEGEGDGEGEVEIGADGEKKIKKKGLGKAGGMRRRKMAMKK